MARRLEAAVKRAHILGQPTPSASSIKIVRTPGDAGLMLVSTISVEGERAIAFGFDPRDAEHLREQILQGIEAAEEIAAKDAASGAATKDPSN
jgi:hypothetical protein